MSLKKRGQLDVAARDFDKFVSCWAQCQKAQKLHLLTDLSCLRGADRRSRPRRRSTMFDAYTKTVLTVIAVALFAIAVQGAVGDADAVDTGCGDIFNPCFVRVVD